MTALVAFLVAATVLAGCTSGASKARDGALPVDGRAGDLGGVNGTVYNENGARLKGVHVVLVTTKLFADTDAKGDFDFKDVAPGQYVLRADLEQYAALESAVVVEAGKVRRVEITLAASNGRGVGFREHVHDLWTAPVMNVFTGDVSVPPDELHGGTHQPCAKATNPVSGAPTVSSNLNSCYYLPIWPERDHIVWPGTDRLDVKVAWQHADTVPAIDFQYAPANSTTLRTRNWMGQGETISVPVTDGMNDHGHQVISMWTFQLAIYPRLVGNDAADNQSVVTDEIADQTIGSFHVTIDAHRGPEVPTEPAHARYWEKGNRLAVATDLQKTLAGATGAPRNPRATVCNGYDPCFSLPAKSIVPPGTTRLEITLDYHEGNAAVEPLAAKKTLAFRTAAVDTRRVDWDQIRTDPPASNTGGRAVWSLPVKGDEQDAFYQSKSLWIFLIGKVGGEKDAQYQSDCPTVYCGGDLFTLNVVAVNDDWTPELAGG